MSAIDWPALEREVEAWLKARFGNTSAPFGWTQEVRRGGRGYFTILRIPSRLEFALPFCIRTYLSVNNMPRNPGIEAQFNKEYTLPLRQHLRALGYEFDTYIETKENTCAVRFWRIPKPRAKPLPSVRTISTDLRVDTGTAQQIRLEIENAEARGRGRDVEEALRVINALLHAHGVEVINGEHFRGGYWADAVAVYVNQGESYAATIVYDTQRDTWEVISWGDWMERAERRGERVP